MLPLLSMNSCVPSFEEFDELANLGTSDADNLYPPDIEVEVRRPAFQPLTNVASAQHEQLFGLNTVKSLMNSPI